MDYMGFIEKLKRAGEDLRQAFPEREELAVFIAGVSEGEVPADMPVPDKSAGAVDGTPVSDTSSGETDMPVPDTSAGATVGTPVSDMSAGAATGVTSPADTKAAAFMHLMSEARQAADRHYGKKIYLRGLIEFTNYCKNDCHYCGIRRSNSCAERYRLSDAEIMECCRAGYALGYRTFVLQGGEDAYFTAEKMADIVRQIKSVYPDCAITLSVGERSREDYILWKKAGADRYLLRHETADLSHYKRLHPDEMSLENRKKCLFNLREAGYQVGSGFMVGSPYQTALNLADDLILLNEIRPHMIGIGPFVPHRDTPFKDEKAGTVRQTLVMIAMLRLLFPKALIPATTSLGTIAGYGRELGIMAGANVIMPNLSPENVRGKYTLYDNKICTGAEAAECKNELEKRLLDIGYTVADERGDSLVPF